MSYVKHNVKSGDAILAETTNAQDDQIMLNEANIMNLQQIVEANSEETKAKIAMALYENIRCIHGYFAQGDIFDSYDVVNSETGEYESFPTSNHVFCLSCGVVPGQTYVIRGAFFKDLPGYAFAKLITENNGSENNPDINIIVEDYYEEKMYELGDEDAINNLTSFNKIITIPDGYNQLYVNGYTDGAIEHYPPEIYIISPYGNYNHNINMYYLYAEAFRPKLPTMVNDMLLSYLSPGDYTLKMTTEDGVTPTVSWEQVQGSGSDSNALDEINRKIAVAYYENIKLKPGYIYASGQGQFEDYGDQNKDDFYYAYCSVVPGTRFRVSGVTYKDHPLYVFGKYNYREDTEDEDPYDDFIFEGDLNPKIPTEQSDHLNIFDEVITVPDGYTILYVNGHTDYAAVIEILDCNCDIARADVLLDEMKNVMPKAPTDQGNGTFVLKATVNASGISYQWVKET